MRASEINYRFELYCNECDDPLQGHMRGSFSHLELRVDPCEKCLDSLAKLYEPEE